MKKALQPEKMVEKPEQKNFNRENVGRSLESMIKNLEGSIVDDKPSAAPL